MRMILAYVTDVLCISYILPRHLPDTELTDSITSQIDWDRLAFECVSTCIVLY